jgi:ligand-binding sensor domain-containing protein
MWIASSDRGPFRWDGKELRPLPAANGLNVSRAGKVYRDGEGQIWFSTRGSGVVRWDAASTNLVDAGLGEAGMAMHCDAQGTWWVGGSRGLRRRGAPPWFTGKRMDWCITT